MNRRIRNLSIAAGAVMLLAFVALASVGSPRSDEGRATRQVRGRGEARTPPAPTTQMRAGLRSYALSLERISGLSSSAPAGARLELWVTWQAPVTSAPRIQRLITGVTLRDIEPPVVPGGPHIALLLVSKAQVPDLIYAERYGALSAAVVSEP